jgi:hypothetical protein
MAWKESLLARTPPWHKVEPLVINTIVDVLADTGLLDSFIWHSMQAGLIANYERIGQLGQEDQAESDPRMIRARISEVLCRTAHQALPLLAKTMTARWVWNRKEKAVNQAMFAGDLFEAAIIFAEDQTVAYGGLATVYRLIGREDKAHNWAARGLARLEQLKQSKAGQALRHSTVFPPDMFEQEERWLRNLLEPIAA